MTAKLGNCPLSREAVIDTYFLEHRAKLLDIAAFLDRVERAQPEAGSAPDFRIQAFNDALAELIQGGADRACRVLEVFSDPTRDLIPAAGTQGAAGAYPGERGPA